MTDQKITIKNNAKTKISAESVAFKIRTKPTSQKIPKFGVKDYDEESVQKRLSWLEEITNQTYPFLAKTFVPTNNWKGNIENLIGVAQVPIGIAGPIKVQGDYASGDYYVPLATSEGALTTVYDIGMRIVSESGGIHTTVKENGMHISPVFFTDSIADSKKLESFIKENQSIIKNIAESTTHHGKLLRIECHIMEKMLVTQFTYTTGDAMGMNMINVATEKACRYIHEQTKISCFIRSNFSSDKKVSSHALTGKIGKSVFAEATISKYSLKKLKVTPEDIYKVWKTGYKACTKANMLGINSHASNGISAIFLATGQDIAELPTSTITHDGCEITDEGDLYFSVYIPSLCLGTIGGGTAKGTSKECLKIMDCFGAGNAMKFAEIIAATALCGEVTTLSAIANDKFVHGHEKYGRNKLQ